MSKYPPIGLDDRLRFGKHKGRQLWEIMDEDPGYVTWLIENTDTTLDNEAWEEYQKRSK